MVEVAERPQAKDKPTQKFRLPNPKEAAAQYLDRKFYELINRNQIAEDLAVIGLAYYIVARDRIGRALNIKSKRIDEDYWSKQIEVGEHMLIVPVTYSDKKPWILEDGTVINSGDKYANIHFHNRLEPPLKGQGLVSYTRELFASAVESLELLANGCQYDNRRLRGIKAFRGVSHIVGPLTERLGLKTQEVKDPVEKLFQYIDGKDVILELLKRHPDKERFKKNYKPPREFVVSRTELIRLFGKEARPPLQVPERKPNIFQRLAGRIHSRIKRH